MEALRNFVKRLESQSIEDAESKVYDTIADIVLKFLSLNADAVHKTVLKSCESYVTRPDIDITHHIGMYRCSIIKGGYKNASTYLLIELGDPDSYDSISSILDGSILAKPMLWADLCVSGSNYAKHCALNKKFDSRLRSSTWGTMNLLDVDCVGPAIHIAQKDGSGYVLNIQFYLDEYLLKHFSTQDQSDIDKTRSDADQITMSRIVSNVAAFLSESKDYSIDKLYPVIRSRITSAYLEAYYKNIDGMMGGLDWFGKPINVLDSPIRISTGIGLWNTIVYRSSDKVDPNPSMPFRKPEIKFEPSDNAKLNTTIRSTGLKYIIGYSSYGTGYSFHNIREIFMEFDPLTIVKTETEAMPEADLNKLIRETMNELISADLTKLRIEWREQFVSNIETWFKLHKSEIIDGFYDFTRRRAASIKHNRLYESYKDRLADVDVPTWYAYVECDIRDICDLEPEKNAYFHPSYYNIEITPDVQTKLNEILGLHGFRFEYKFNKLDRIPVLRKIVIHPPVDLLIIKPK
jgi:hypothetical protein